VSSGELGVVLFPAAEWSQEAKRPTSHHWLTRPLLFLVVAGCAVSMMTAGRVTLRLVLAVMVSASYVPLLQIASLAAACRRALPLRRAVDLFSIGNAPWMLLLLVYAGVWGFLPPAGVYANFKIGRIAAGALFCWSLYVDWWFFRAVAGRGPVAAARDLALQRLLCWGPGVAISIAPSAWQVIESWLGL
jgi:hypothetical protein